MRIYWAKRKTMETNFFKYSKKKFSYFNYNWYNTKAPIIKQQPKGLKYKLNKVIDTNPSYVTRHNNLQPATIHNYINNFNLKNIIICSAML